MDLTNNKVAARAEIDNRLLFRFFQAANTLHKQGTKALEDVGVTTQQWSVLGALSRPQAAEGMSVNALSSFLKMSRQNLAGILNRLERGGYIERTTDGDDRRSRRVKLSQNGLNLWNEMTPLIYNFYDAALTGFSFDDRVEFLHYITKLQDNMNRI